MSAMTEAIARYRAAWNDYQVAPSGLAAQRACDRESEDLAALLMTLPADAGDVLALKSFLDWFVVEEAGRAAPGNLSDLSNWPFAIHAALAIAMDGP